MSSHFNRIWLPGFMLQSVVTGGGYATGRELVEFFLSTGPVGGLLGMLVATALFSLVSILCFELARLTGSFNYRSFFGVLLGRAWFLYEIGYVVLGVLVLAVIAAATSEMLAAHVGLDRAAGTVLLLIPIAALVFWGTSLIEKAFAAWSFLLFAVYAVLVALYLWRFAGALPASLAHAPQAGWFANGVRYFGYNAAVIPLVLFSVRHMTSRRDALAAGLLAGPLIMVPAVLFLVAMSASYPDILDVAVPSDFMLQQLAMPWLQVAFYVVVFGTFVDTGTAFIHALNERIELGFRGRRQRTPAWLRPAVAAAFLLVSVWLAIRLGIVELIARGYGTLTWAFIAVFVGPLCTLGAWKIARAWRGGSCARTPATDSQPALE
jgi:uncharacterized membrane protein YkvI